MQRGYHQLDFTKLLPDIVTIADEVDAHRKQQMLCYVTANAVKVRLATE